MRSRINGFRVKALLAAGLTALALTAGAVAPAVASADNPSQREAAASSGVGIEIVVRGVVAEGVERGCLILQPLISGPTGRPYLLLGGDPKVIYPGARVEVRGVLEKVATYCQQGTPLRVLSATPI